MRIGRPLAIVAISVEQREELENWSRRPKTAQALAMRSRIVLLAANGSNNTSIARQLSTTVQTVGKWRRRFLASGCDGLLDEPRPGTSRKLSDKQVELVLARTLESQPEAATHWSTRDMAKACGLSQSSISRIWRAFSLAPHRAENFKLSHDPLFIEKVRDIVAPIHWLGAAVPGTTRRSGPASPRTLSAVPGQTSTHLARLLHPHDHRRRLRRPDPRATLPLPDLPPHRVPAARVRAALPAFQRYGDRAVPRRAPAPGENSRRRTAAIVASPARPVLAAPLPRASRSVVRRVGRADQARPRAWLRSTCARHARILPLDPRSSLPFRQCPPAPAGLA